jgi:hypothetical protein
MSIQKVVYKVGTTWSEDVPNPTQPKILVLNTIAGHFVSMSFLFNL